MARKTPRKMIEKRGVSVSPTRKGLPETFEEKGREDDERKGTPNQHGAGGAILGGADARVLVGVKVIQNYFYRRIKKLGREYAGDTNTKENGPKRAGPQENQNAQSHGGAEELSSKTLFHAKGGPHSPQGKL